MVQQYIKQFDRYGNPFTLHYDEVRLCFEQFNRNPKAKAYGVSISLTGEDKSGYAYYAVLKYKGIKIEFLVHPDMSWGLEDTVIASREGQYCYFSAWNLWVELFGIG
jgi:hypothetical protein